LPDEEEQRPGLSRGAKIQPEELADHGVHIHTRIIPHLGHDVLLELVLFAALENASNPIRNERLHRLRRLVDHDVREAPSFANQGRFHGVMIMDPQEHVRQLRAWRAASFAPHSHL
jgi:hypothetical protein